MIPNITGLVGRGIQRSLSPCIHRAFFDAAGIPGNYLLFDAQNAEELDELIGRLKAGQVKGLNVTSPYKVKIIRYCNDLSTIARRCQAVNTLYVNNGRVVGELTDTAGFTRAMSLHGVSGKTALVMGSGGAARAVIAGLYDLGFESIAVYARNPVTSADLQAIFPFIRLKPPEFAVDLVINATPVTNNSPDPFLPGPMDAILKAGGVFFDLNYHGLTMGMRLAQDVGRKAVNGLAMLVFQAGFSWQSWFGQDPLNAISADEVMQRCADVKD